MKVFRIVKKNRADDISGTGAVLNPGRWNKRGTAVLYTSESKALALLEVLVHLPGAFIPQYTIITLEIPDDSILTIKISDLPANWYQYPAPTILSEITLQWIDDGKYIALQVPSCIIHTSHNYILNCHHKEYKKVKILEKQNFYFDKRLRK